jgi:hypothetical protein
MRMHDQKPRRIARGNWTERDTVFRQREIEQIGAHGKAKLAEKAKRFPSVSKLH